MNKTKKRAACRRIRQIVRYAKNVFCLWVLCRKLRDGRSDPIIPAWHVFTALIAGFLLKMKSLNHLDRMLRRFGLNLVLKARDGVEAIASRSTIQRSLKEIDIEGLRKILVKMVRQAKRNKMFEEGAIGALLYAAIDGTEVLSSEEPIPDATGIRRKKVERGGEKVEVKEWYVSAVMAQVVGVSTPMVMDLERQKARDGDKPSEGELTAAKRLIQRLYDTYGSKFLDGLVLDALYGCEPILKWFDDKRWFVVFRLDPDSMKNLYEDARWLFDMRKPDEEDEYEWNGARIKYRMWDEEGFKWRDVKSPLRVLKFEEEKIYVNGKIEKQEIWFVAKSLSKQRISGRKIRMIFRQRWNEENGFKELKHEWNLEHGFIYHGHAVGALWLIAAITYNLFRAFVVRRLRMPVGRGRASLRQVREDLFWSVAALKGPLWDLIGFDTS